MSGFLHQACRLVDLEQTQVATTLDRQQHALRAVDAGFEQRAGDRELGGLDRTVLAAGRTDSHERGARALHDRLHVGEVEVDQTRGRDQVGDALDTGQQHLVGAAEGVEHRYVAVADRQQSVVRDDDEGVDLVTQRVDAEIGLTRSAASFEGERAGDHTDGERAEVLGDLRDDRCTTGTGATTFACGHEDHVGTLEDLFDLFLVVLGGLATDLGVGARAEPTGQLTTDLELHVGVAHEQCLRVGVDRDELDALEPLFDHPVHGVHPAAADADDLDDCEVILRRCHERWPSCRDLWSSVDGRRHATGNPRYLRRMLRVLLARRDCQVRLDVDSARRSRICGPRAVTSPAPTVRTRSPGRAVVTTRSTVS